MAIKDFPNVSPDANATFGLESNTSEFRSVINNDTQHMSLPGDRWRGSVSFTNRTRQEANKVKAFKAALGGAAGRFYFTPCDAYQAGTMQGAGVIDGAVASGSSVLPTNGWAADQDTLFEYGDYLEVNGELKMVVGDVVAPQSYIEYTGTNYMPSPFDPEGWYGATSDPDGTITNVTLENPSGENFVGLAEQTGAGGFIFATASASKIPSVLSGEKVYAAFIYKISNFPAYIQTYAVGVGGSGNFNLDLTNKTAISSPGWESNFTELSGGYCLLETSYIVNSDSLNVSQDFILRGAGVSIPPIGSQLYVQAAYFGKADDWPANLLATADIPIAPPLRKALTGGETITTTDPKGVFYLGSDSQEWSINVNGVQDMGFDFIEDVS